MAITNSVKNILTGFGATGARGGVANNSGAPGGSPLNMSATVQFAAGVPGINVGYVKVKVTGLIGGATPAVIGVVVYGGDFVHQNSQLAQTSFPAGLTPPNGWEGDFIFPFVAEYQYNWFNVMVVFFAGTTFANLDFEVWGNAMAGGQ